MKIIRQIKRFNSLIIIVILVFSMTMDLNRLTIAHLRKGLILLISTMNRIAIKQSWSICLKLKGENIKMIKGQMRLIQWNRELKLKLIVKCHKVAARVFRQLSIRMILNGGQVERGSLSYISLRSGSISLKLSINKNQLYFTDTIIIQAIMKISQGKLKEVGRDNLVYWSKILIMKLHTATISPIHHPTRHLNEPNASNSLK